MQAVSQSVTLHVSEKTLPRLVSQSVGRSISKPISLELGLASFAIRCEKATDHEINRVLLLRQQVDRIGC